MAPKFAFFLLAFVLVATRMGSSVQEFSDVTEVLLSAPSTSPMPPAGGPSSPLPWGFGTACTAMCAVRCKPMQNRPFRACQRACTACCISVGCVPNFSKCGCQWTTITVRGKAVKCP